MVIFATVTFTALYKLQFTVGISLVTVLCQVTHCL